MLSDERFAEMKTEWLETGRRTNWFERPDSAVPKMFGERPDQSTISSLIVDISNFSRIPVAKLIGRTQRQEVCHWRLLGYYAAYRDLGKTCQQIGKIFNRDESTVNSGMKRFSAFMQQEPEWLHRYEKIARDLA